MTEPRTEAGRALLQNFREMAEKQTYIKPPARLIDSGRAAILAIEQQAAKAAEATLAAAHIMCQPSAPPVGEALRAVLDETVRMLDYLWTAEGLAGMPVRNSFADGDPLYEDVPKVIEQARAALQASAAEGPTDE